MRHLRLTIYAIIASFTIAGCGGSDSAPPATGTLAVIITDGPTDQFEQILVTLERMLLLGGNGGQQVVYDGPAITFDLLALRDRADFAFAGEIIADDYSKIRLEVSEIQLVDISNPTDPVVVTPVDLPANGKIDLNPRGPFTIEAGQTTIVELDMDANRSFQVVEQGNGGFRLRPIFFVNVYKGDILLPSKLVRVFGTVAVDGVVNTDTEKSALVCELQFVAQLGAPVTDSLDDCVRIFPDLTGIFGEDGMATDFADITAGAELTGIGFLTPGDADVLFNLDAVVTEIGGHQPPSPTGWETLRGVVVSAQEDCDAVMDPQFFCFEPFDTDMPIKTILQAETRVFDSRGNELSQADVDADEAATVDGLRVTNGTEEELLAALVVLNSDLADLGDVLVSGELTDVMILDDYDVLTLHDMLPDVMTNVCVTEETDVLRVLVDDEVITIVDLLDPAALDPSAGHIVEAAGSLATADMPECDILADIVIVE
ncbi:MAG: DUF4382 domain-containing protein [Gammaproteobacteria bacterium]|nr:DUF4382 domain-containing protein [Gammaproteobacteria bacterium]